MLTMSAFRTLDHVEVKGKRVLVRADLNAPVESGVVTDATRIDRVAPSITELADKGARVAYHAADVGVEAEVRSAAYEAIRPALRRSMRMGICRSRSVPATG